jgi:hypothetical protein
MKLNIYQTSNIAMILHILIGTVLGIFTIITAAYNQLIDPLDIADNATIAGVDLSPQTTAYDQRVHPEVPATDTYRVFNQVNTCGSYTPLVLLIGMTVILALLLW